MCYLLSRESMMRVLYTAFLLLMTSMVFAQDGPVPNDLCKYERAKGRVQQVKISARYSLDLSLGPRPLNLRPGTQVLVFKLKGSWACVAGDVQTKQGPVLTAGWIEASKLEPLGNDSISESTLQPAPPPPPPSYPEQINGISGHGLLFLVFSAGGLSPQSANQIQLLRQNSELLEKLHIRVAFIKPPFMGKMPDPSDIPMVQLTEHARLQADKLARAGEPTGFLGILVNDMGRALLSSTSPVSPQKLAEILARSTPAPASKRP